MTNIDLAKDEKEIQEDLALGFEMIESEICGNKEADNTEEASLWERVLFAFKKATSKEIDVKDKNGRMICEGDRVRSTFRGKIGTIVLRPGRFVLRFDDGLEMTFLDENSYRLTVQEGEQ